MSWNRIIGQDRVKAILQKAIVEDRVAHAYCFWGIEGIGKEGLAVEFAKALNCNNPVRVDDSIEACGVCQSCRQISILQHPNILMVFSLPAGKSSDSRTDTASSRLSEDQLKAMQEQISAKASNPYHNISMSNATQIRIASIRDVKKSLMLSPPQMGRRCILVFRADEMTKEAANAFLKTLEEPHSNTTLILTTSKRDQILPTILSRCQQIHCAPLPLQTLAEAISSRHGISLEESRLIAAFGQGSYTKSLEFLDEGMKQMRQEVVEAFRTSLKKKIFRSELYERLDKLFKANDKKMFETFLTLLIFWIRDAATIIASGSDSNIVNIDQKDVISRFASNFSGRNFDNAINNIEIAILQIKRNVQPQLIFLNLFLKLREVML
jgi:DNA polymerase-3 subunit delta'